ncbi:MAG: hypothetical protein P0Y56_11780 [Candidatus Andeanibacterium colombiense]|uniref:Uncharacterized protein n=1 Tax=Candidatus Andeanibacterium colombiense TaxID=3121345 RepID=A0AAJ5X6X2_9SPHN|nr:MAG: hypothetical protein P0Y56_11780 [Sphingomonadaceae bacterium]
MRRMHIALLAGAAAALALAAGTAYAETAKTHHMDVALPDGSVAHIAYVGDVAPKVTVEPGARSRATAFGDPFAQAGDPFAGMDRMVAAMQARHDAMMRQMAALERSAGSVAQATAGAPGQLVASGNLPAGSHFTMVQSSTDANGCTRTVRISSDGASQQPMKQEVSSGKCDKAERSDAPAPVPAEAAPVRRYVPGAV